MDVDPSPSSSTISIIPGFVASGLPKIDENNIYSTKPAKQQLIELLDALESRIEKLRKEASQLEEERDSLLATLDSVRNTDLITELDESRVEREDIQYYAERIMNRCLTIELKIHTQRDKTQEDALHQINYLIDNLVMNLKHDPDGTKVKCISYMNACSSRVEGPTDKNFESCLLGCTLDDQKRVKKRLSGLMTYVEKVNVFPNVD